MPIPSPTFTTAAGGAVTTKALTSNVATLTTTTPHGLVVGDSVVVAGVDATFNGTYTLTGVTANTVSYARTKVNVTSEAGTGTLTPATMVLTEARPSVTLVGTDTGTYTPAATSRRFRVGGVAIPDKTASPAQLRVQRAGTVAIDLQVTNADGTADSADVTITVTDTVATQYANAKPLDLPLEYRDPMIATPGLVTAIDLANARQFGTVGATTLLAVG